MHPHALVGVDHRSELGLRVHPGADPQRPRARGRARRGRARRARWWTKTRSTEPQDWPAPANALAATSLGRPRRDRRPRRRSPGGCPPPPRPGATTRSTEGCVASGRAARSSPCSSCRTPPRSSSSTIRSAASGAFSDGLSTTALPVTSAAAERAAGRGQRVAPRHQDRDDAARLAQHEVAAWRRGRGRPGRARRRPRRRRSRPRRRRATPRSGIPTSSVCSAASSRACSRSARAPAFSSEPRASGAVRAHGPARRARRPPSGSPRGRRRPGCGRWRRRWRGRGRRAPVHG